MLVDERCNHKEITVQRTQSIIALVVFAAINLPLFILPTLILFISNSGFAFITFKEFESVQEILDAHSKDPIKIDEKIVRLTMLSLRSSC